MTLRLFDRRFATLILGVSFFLSATGLPVEVTAAQQDGVKTETQRAAILEITPDECRYLSRHVADPGVAYQPGVDVRGRKVAPADLSGSDYSPSIRPPKTIVIPIEIDLFDRFGIPANPALFKGDAEVGEVIYDDGKLYFNGQRLADGASDEIALYCRDLLEARGNHKR